MARDESDKEDLFAEVRGLSPRVEFRAADDPESAIVLGARRDGGFSLYLGSDPVWHFDAENRLRRGFVDGQIVRTAGTTLSVMTRERTATETRLVRRDLDEEECSALLDRCRAECELIVQCAAAGRLVISREEPENGNAAEECLTRLKLISASPTSIAPAIAGRR